MLTFSRLKSKLKHEQKYDEYEAVFILENVSDKRFTIFVFRNTSEDVFKTLYGKQQTVRKNIGLFLRYCRIPLLSC